MHPIPDEKILEQLEWNFPLIQEKFKEGMVKYKTPIYEKDCLHEAFNEAYDLLSYLTTIKAQRANAVKLAITLANRYSIFDDAEFNKLLVLLGVPQQQQPSLYKQQ